MKFLANENYPQPSIEEMRKAGYEVQSIREDWEGISDMEVLELAKQGNQIILTFDRDYEEIVYKHKPNNPPSIVYFRYKGKSPNEAGKNLIELIQSGLRLEGYFTVIEENGIRQRKL